MLSSYNTLSLEIQSHLKCWVREFIFDSRNQMISRDIAEAYNVLAILLEDYMNGYVSDNKDNDLYANKRETIVLNRGVIDRGITRQSNKE